MLSIRPKVLFFAEEVTLAHVGRMLALAGALDPRRFDIAFACGPRYRSLVERDGLRVTHLDSLSPSEFADCIASGKPVFTRERLAKLVADDLALIARESPDLVVSDFRCSLGISAELARIPCICVTNGVWSPNSTLAFPVPELPAVRLMGVPLAKRVFPLVTPLILRQHIKPFNELRRSLGLRPLHSLQEAYTHGRHTLYTDLPKLAPVTSLPHGHEYVGPVLWEPAVTTPPWWNHLAQGRPTIYVSGGSSGDSRILSAVAEALGDKNVTVMVATAGREAPALPSNFLVAPYLPGLACARRAQLVICNGGSGSIYQALAEGVPVLGIPSNADQYLCTGALAAQGAGRLLRAGQLTAAAVLREVKTLLREESYSRAARVLQAEVKASDAPGRFAQLVEAQTRPSALVAAVA